MALALMLLAGAGLLLRSFHRVLEVDPGFQSENVLTAALSLAPTAYKDAVRVNSFYTQLEGKLEQIPGAKAAGMSNDLPLESEREGALTVKGYTTAPGAGLALTAFTFTMGDYFRAMGIPLIEGRLFTPADDERGQKVVIISRMLAKKYFGDRNPMGANSNWGLQEAAHPG
jgi:hypothetical protein